MAGFGGAISTGSEGASTSTSSSDQRFVAGGDAALAALIQQLLGGGTVEQRQQRADRQGEVGAVRQQRADYSKEAAFGDAQGAMAQQLRLAMEKVLPSLVRSAEGAGTSQNSMRALLLQDAAAKSAESASALGLQAAKDYGAISGNLSSVLEALTRPNDQQTTDLLKALEISKLSSSSSASTGSSSSNGGGSYSSGAPRVGASVDWSHLMDSHLPPAPSQNNLWANDQGASGGNDGVGRQFIGEPVYSASSLVGKSGYAAGGWKDYAF